MFPHIPISALKLKHPILPLVYTVKLCTLLQYFEFNEAVHRFGFAVFSRAKYKDQYANCAM